MCGVNMENHEEAHISYAVRLGKVFGLRPNTFLFCGRFMILNRYGK